MNKYNLTLPSSSQDRIKIGYADNSSPSSSTTASPIMTESGKCEQSLTSASRPKSLPTSLQKLEKVHSTHDNYGAFSCDMEVLKCLKKIISREEINHYDMCRQLLTELENMEMQYQKITQYQKKLEELKSLPNCNKVFCAMLEKRIASEIPYSAANNLSDIYRKHVGNNNRQSLQFNGKDYILRCINHFLNCFSQEHTDSNSSNNLNTENQVRYSQDAKLESELFLTKQVMAEIRIRNIEKEIDSIVEKYSSALSNIVSKKVKKKDLPEGKVRVMYDMETNTMDTHYSVSDNLGYEPSPKAMSRVTHQIRKAGLSKEVSDIDKEMGKLIDKRLEFIKKYMNSEFSEEDLSSMAEQWPRSKHYPRLAQEVKEKTGEVDQQEQIKLQKKEKLAEEQAKKLENEIKLEKPKINRTKPKEQKGKAKSNEKKPLKKPTDGLDTSVVHNSSPSTRDKEISQVKNLIKDNRSMLTQKYECDMKTPPILLGGDNNIKFYPAFEKKNLTRHVENRHEDLIEELEEGLTSGGFSKGKNSDKHLVFSTVNSILNHSISIDASFNEYHHGERKPTFSIDGTLKLKEDSDEKTHVRVICCIPRKDNLDGNNGDSINLAVITMFKISEEKLLQKKLANNT